MSTDTETADICTICQYPLTDPSVQDEVWKLPECGCKFHAKCLIGLFRCDPIQYEILTAEMLKVKCPNDRHVLMEHEPYRTITQISNQGRPSRGLISCSLCSWEVDEFQFGTHLLDQHSCQQCKKTWTDPREDRIMLSKSCCHEVCAVCFRNYFRNEPPYREISFECPGLGGFCQDRVFLRVEQAGNRLVRVYICDDEYKDVPSLKSRVVEASTANLRVEQYTYAEYLSMLGIDTNQDGEDVWSHDGSASMVFSEMSLDA